MFRIAAIIIIFSLTIFLFGCNSEGKRTIQDEKIVVDDLGDSLVIKNSPERIISLAPNLTEIIFYLDLEEYLVGNTLFCNYPEEAKDIMKVGDLLTFDYEKIIQLKPDIIFITVEGNTKAAYNKFKELGLKVFVSNPRDFAGIKKSFSDIANIFDEKELADSIISGWNSTIENIQKKSEKYPSKKVMFMVDLQPPYVAGKNTFINEMINFCGMKNIAKDSPLNYPIFNREEILKRNPDFIFYSTDTTSDINILEYYPEWDQVKAVKNDNFVLVDRDIFSRPGPRYTSALKTLFQKLHQ